MLTGSLTLALLETAPTLAADLPTTGSNLVLLANREYIDSLRSGGPGMDGIHSIDEPTFWSVEEADEFLESDDRVIGLYHNG